MHLGQQIVGTIPQPILAGIPQQPPVVQPMIKQPLPQPQHQQPQQPQPQPQPQPQQPQPQQPQPQHQPQPQQPSTSHPVNHSVEGQGNLNLTPRTPSRRSSIADRPRNFITDDKIREMVFFL